MSRQDVFKRIRTYVTSNYQKLDTKDFVLGDAPFNRRCHLNSVQKVKEGKAKKVFSCFAIDTDDNSQCVHFINQLEDGKYQDNTWGWLYEKSEYYIIKEVDSIEQNKIWDVLSDTKKMLLNLNSNWLERFIFKINKELI
jgi:hypothetical protein